MPPLDGAQPMPPGPGGGTIVEPDGMRVVTLPLPCTVIELPLRMIVLAVRELPVKPDAAAAVVAVRSWAPQTTRNGHPNAARARDSTTPAPLANAGPGWRRPVQAGTSDSTAGTPGEIGP